MTIFFISGPINFTPYEFSIYYEKRIKDAIYINSSFVVGDANGVDKLAQEFIYNFKINNKLFSNITVFVYHIGSKPRNNIGNWPTVGNFKTDDERDSRMTSISDEDILYLRSEDEKMKIFGKKYKPFKISGTEKNFYRRVDKNKILLSISYE